MSASSATVQTLHELRLSAIYAAELAGVIIFHERRFDAKVALARLQPALRTLLQRTQQAIDALEREGEP